MKFVNVTPFPSSQLLTTLNLFYKIELFLSDLGKFLGSLPYKK